jgi:hypothetical protein
VNEWESPLGCRVKRRPQNGPYTAASLLFQQREAIQYVQRIDARGGADASLASMVHRRRPRQPDVCAARQRAYPDEGGASDDAPDQDEGSGVRCPFPS